MNVSDYLLNTLLKDTYNILNVSYKYTRQNDDCYDYISYEYHRLIVNYKNQRHLPCYDFFGNTVLKNTYILYLDSNRNIINKKINILYLYNFEDYNIHAYDNDNKNVCVKTLSENINLKIAKLHNLI